MTCPNKDLIFSVGEFVYKRIYTQENANPPKKTENFWQIYTNDIILKKRR
jgi:hypothetical protein